MPPATRPTAASAAKIDPCDHAQLVLEGEEEDGEQGDGAAAGVGVEDAGQQNGRRQQGKEEVACEAAFLPSQKEQRDDGDEHLSQVVWIVDDAEATNAQQDLVFDQEIRTFYVAGEVCEHAVRHHEDGDERENGGQYFESSQGGAGERDEVVGEDDG